MKGTPLPFSGSRALPTPTQMAYPGPTSPCLCLLLGVRVSSMNVCSMKGVTPRFSCRPGPKQADAGVGGRGSGPSGSPIPGGAGVDRAGIFRMYTNQSLRCEQRTFCKLPHPNLDHCSGLPLLSLLLQSPSNLGCLPAAARALLPNHKSDHITPHAPASSPSHQKPERSQTPGGPRSSAQPAGLGPGREVFSAVSPHLPSPSISAVSFLAFSSL